MSIEQETAPFNATVDELAVARMQSDAYDVLSHIAVEPENETSEVDKPSTKLGELQHRVEQCREDGYDAFQAKENERYQASMANVSIGSSTSGLGSILTGAFTDNPNLLYVGAAGIGAGLGIINHFRKDTRQDAGREDWKSLAVHGHSIEIVTYTHEDGDPAVAAVVLPIAHDDERTKGILNRDQVTELAYVLDASGVDSIVLPGGLATAMRPEAAADAPLASLGSHLKYLKPDLDLRPADKVQQHKAYVHIDAGDFSTAGGERTIKTPLLMPEKYPQDKQVVIRKLIDHLYGKFGDIDDMPFASDRQLVPGSRQSIEKILDDLRPHAERALRETVSATSYKDRIEDVRLKTNYYTVPCRANDQFDVALQVYDAAGGQVPDKLLLSKVTVGDRAVQEILGRPELLSSDVLPAVGYLFQELKQLHVFYSRDSEDKLTEIAIPVSEQDPLVLEAGMTWGDRALEVQGRDRAQNLVHRTRKVIGSMALGAVLMPSTFLGLTYVATEAVAKLGLGADTSLDSPVGRSESTGSPVWKLEAHGDVGEAGYYSSDKSYRFDAKGMKWIHQSNEGWQILGDLDTVPTENYMTVSGWYFNNGEGKVTEVYLPIREQTVLASARVTDAEGNAVPFTALSRPDGTTKLSYNAKGTAEYISYDLVAGKNVSKATQDMTVDGINNPPVEVSDGYGPLAKDRMAMKEEFTYDNTEELDTVLDGVEDWPAFKQRVMAAKIANCNIAATTLSIENEARGSTDPLAYTTGYEVGEDNGGFLNEPHAWLVDGNGQTYDGTPPLRGRTAEAAGLPDKSTDELKKEWQDLVDAAHRPPVKPPYEAIELGLAGAIMAVSLTGRPSYWRRRFLDWRADRNRNLTPAQAERVLTQAAYGDITNRPILEGVTERTPVAVDNLGKPVLETAITAPFKIAPYLTVAERQDLRRYAAKLLRERTATSY